MKYSGGQSFKMGLVAEGLKPLWSVWEFAKLLAHNISAKNCQRLHANFTTHFQMMFWCRKTVQ